jgi:hypothetical protein
MYGIDRDKVGYDYDLISAYTTGMSRARQTDYENCRRLTPDELRQLSNEDILYSYLVIQADFIFPSRGY